MERITHFMYKSNSHDMRKHYTIQDKNYIIHMFP